MISGRRGTLGGTGRRRSTRSGTAAIVNVPVAVFAAAKITAKVTGDIAVARFHGSDPAVNATATATATITATATATTASTGLATITGLVIFLSAWIYLRRALSFVFNHDKFITIFGVSSISRAAVKRPLSVWLNGRPSRSSIWYVGKGGTGG